MEISGVPYQNELLFLLITNLARILQLVNGFDKKVILSLFFFADSPKDNYIIDLLCDISISLLKPCTFFPQQLRILLRRDIRRRDGVIELCFIPELSAA